MPSIFDTPANPEPEPPPRYVSSDEGLRVGHAERQEALSVLNDSYVAGRIDATELERRTLQVAAAVTRGDLQSATANLPGTQAIAQSFAARLNEINADLQADEERRQTAAAQAAAGAQEAADAVARLFREFATSLKDAVPPRPIKTGQLNMRKVFMSRPRSEEIISPRGYQLYPNPGSQEARGRPSSVTVVVPDGRIWQSTEILYNSGIQSEKQLFRPNYRAGYVNLTADFVFADYSFILTDRLLHRGGRPFVRTYNYSSETEGAEPLEDYLAKLAARMMQGTA